MNQKNKVIKTSTIFLKKKGRALFLIIPFLIVNLIIRYGFEAIIVNGDSMEPAYSHGDIVIILKTPVSYENGDAVVAIYNNYHVLKRIAGKPGDTITSIGADTFGNIKIPHTVADNSYFLLGDNRAISHDSRFSDFGDIPKDKIIGKVIYKIQRRVD